MSLLVALPLTIPLIGAAAGIAAWGRPRINSVIGIASAGALFAAAMVLLVRVYTQGPISLQVGGWPFPAGIGLQADMFSAAMVLVAGILALVGSIYAYADLDDPRQRNGAYPLLLVMIMGVCGALLTRDLFNLYVWFEVMLIASFVLLALGSEGRQLRGAVVYVAINLLSSALLLSAVGLVYHAARTLDMLHLAERMSALHQQEPFIMLAAEAMLLVAFGVKAAIFPLFFWLPASYHTPPPVISALFAGLLTKVGVYAMIRVSLVIFPITEPVFLTIGIIAAFTMLTGVLGALAQNHFRRIISFHIVSQIGYMIAGVALVNVVDPELRRFALAASIFFIIHNIIAKTNLFLVAGIVRRRWGTEELKQLGGEARAHPWLAASFLLSALSLAGIPPLSGFWAKVAIIDAGLRAEAYLLTAVAVITGLLTLMSMMKIWMAVFWRPARVEQTAKGRGSLILFGPSAVLALLTLAIGLQPHLLSEISDTAAGQLLEQARFLSGGNP